nr:hypothetical protein [Tanacetum cinerariifolium]
MIDVDYQMATQVQIEEQEALSIEEKSKLFVQLLEARKKHFTTLRAKEKRIKPPTKAQKRNTMSTYLKNMAGYKQNQLKTKSFEDNQMLFDKEMKRVNTFVDMDTKLVKGSETRAEESSKRAGEDIKSDKFKKQKLERRPEEAYERVLCGDLKVMFEPDIENEVQRKLQGHKVTVWKLFSSCGVHFMRFQNLHIFMLVEKRIKRLYDDLRVTAAQAYVSAVKLNLVLFCNPNENYANWLMLLEELMLSELKLLTRYVQDVYGKD